MLHLTNKLVFVQCVNHKEIYSMQVINSLSTRDAVGEAGGVRDIFAHVVMSKSRARFLELSTR
jgi:hypothetical protein